MNNKISAVFRYKGSVPTYADLIVLTEMVVGDVYNVTETGDNYAWTDTEWDKLAGEIDLTAYLTKGEALITYETIENVQTLNDTVNGHIESNLHLTEEQRIKLEGIAAGAEVNVQSDWNQTTNTADDYIKNKPTIPIVPSDVLIYGAQTLTDPQKTQARTNIGAGTSSFSGSYNDLSNKPNIIPDVPTDSKIYGRQNGNWSEIVNSGGGGGITDAPSNNKTYGRKNATWSEIDISSYINDSPSDGLIYGRKDGNWEQIDTSGGGDIKAYASERVNAVGGSIALKLDTKTIISNTLTNSDSLTITLPTPRLNFVNESILTIKIGSTVPNITLPAITGWYTDVVALAPTTTRTIVFEQITFDGINYEVWASCDKQ